MWLRNRLGKLGGGKGGRIPLNVSHARLRVLFGGNGVVARRLQKLVRLLVCVVGLIAGGGRGVGQLRLAEAGIVEFSAFGGVVQHLSPIL